jgi:sugar diacid utilization regulator
MASVADLLRAPGLERVRLLAGPARAAPVTAAVVVEEPVRVGDAPAGAVCLLTGAASELEGYQLDMCLRAAAAADAAALALYGMDDRPPPRSAQVIASKTAVALLAVPAEFDPGSFCIAAQRAIDGDAVLWLARLERLREQLARLAPEASVEEIVRAAGEVLGAQVTLASPSDGADALALDVVAPAGRPLYRVEAEGSWGGLAAVLCANAATRRADAARRSEEAPIRSRAGILTELLLGSRGDAAAVAERARELGIPVDGWHVATQLEVAGQGVDAAGDAVATHALREEVFHLALRAARTIGSGSWSGTQLRSAVVLVCTQRSDPGLRATAEMIRLVERVVQRLRGRWPDMLFAAGVGGPHEGVEGLHATAAEASAAASIARGEERGGEVVGFDAVGLRRMLLAWSGSDPARKAIDDLLAPLDRLGGAKTDAAVRTLAAYLAEQGSLVRAGARLHLHRNAVAYRIRRIAALLEADLADPDDRFALELACRARLVLGSGSAA